MSSVGNNDETPLKTQQSSEDQSNRKAAPGSALTSFVTRNKLQTGKKALGPAGWKALLSSTVKNLQKGKIPLLLAVEAGNQSMCRELLSQQTIEQLKATTENGDTALHLAARRRDVDMVRILVDYGANVDAQNSPTGEKMPEPGMITYQSNGTKKTIPYYLKDCDPKNTPHVGDKTIIPGTVRRSFDSYCL